MIWLKVLYDTFLKLKSLIWLEIIWMQFYFKVTESTCNYMNLIIWLISRIALPLKKNKIEKYKLNSKLSYLKTSQHYIKPSIDHFNYYCTEYSSYAKKLSHTAVTLYIITSYISCNAPNKCWLNSVQQQTC